MSERDEVIDALREVDAALARTPRGALSLDPSRRCATPLAELGTRLLARDDPPSLARGFGEMLAQVARAQLDNFPENLFWDFDYFAACSLASARAAADPIAHLAQTRQLSRALSRSFGCHSPIRFRYVDDFSYGFDWARWVKGDPDARAAVGPFDLVFLRSVLHRGQELTALARRDDPAFPRLDDRQAWRNPFGFSREPEQEVVLHRTLAARGRIPVFAWRTDASPDWRLSYTRLRAQVARELGIPPQD